MDSLLHKGQKHLMLLDRIPAYCISLLASTERWRDFERQFAQANLCVPQRVIAVEPHESFNWIVKEQYGCYLSHVRLLKQLLADRVEIAMVYEDDARFGSNYEVRFEEAYAALPMDWEFVYVGHRQDAPVEMINEKISLPNVTWCTHAYLLKSTVLPFLVANMKDIKTHFDNQLLEYCVPHIKAYCFEPSLVSQG